MELTNNSPEKLLLKIGEVAEMLQISPRSVKRLVNAGELPGPQRYGRSTRWPKKEIEAHVEQQCRNSRARHQPR